MSNLNDFNHKSNKPEDFLYKDILNKYDNLYEYYTLLKMKSTLDMSNFSALDLENSVYCIQERVLTDKEKIKYEFNHIINYLKNNSDLLDSKTLTLVINLLKELKITFKNLNTTEDIEHAKILVFKIQVLLNIKSAFYTIVEPMLNKNEKGKVK